MGYYSHVTTFTYRTNLDETTFEKAKKEFLEKEVSEAYRESVKQYLDELVYDNGKIHFEPEETYGKFYNTNLLAEFVARTIAPGEEVEFYQQGEDCESWGYRIKQNRVIPLKGILTFVPENQVNSTQGITHLCSGCECIKTCPIGPGINDGNWDEYVKDQILEDLNDEETTSDFNFAVITVVVDCSRYQPAKNKIQSE